MTGEQTKLMLDNLQLELNVERLSEIEFIYRFSIGHKPNSFDIRLSGFFLGNNYVGSLCDYELLNIQILENPKTKDNESNTILSNGINISINWIIVPYSIDIAHDDRFKNQPWANKFQIKRNSTLSTEYSASVTPDVIRDILSFCQRLVNLTAFT